MVYRYVKAMAIVLHRVVGHNWGFFSQEDQRMHLQTTDTRKNDTSKIWLESKGKRCFEEEAWELSRKDLQNLREEVEKNRYNIERRWVFLMLDKGWIKIKDFNEATQVISLQIYTDHNAFIRSVNLFEVFPGRRLNKKYRPYARDNITFDFENGVIAVGFDSDPSNNNHIDLVPVIFID
jgi:hypothetical protein